MKELEYLNLALNNITKVRFRRVYYVTLDRVRSWYVTEKFFPGASATEINRETHGMKNTHNLHYCTIGNTVICMYIVGRFPSLIVRCCPKTNSKLYGEGFAAGNNKVRFRRKCFFLSRFFDPPPPPRPPLCRPVQGGRPAVLRVPQQAGPHGELHRPG